MKLPRLGLLPQVSGAHLISHLHMMTLPALLPVLPKQMGVSYVELGLAMSVFNVVSALVQAPLGFAVDRVGARRMLNYGLLLGSLCFLSLGLFHSYAWLLVAMGLAGVANGVYHPADYALLSAGMPEKAIGRAFSIHTFAGFLGGALSFGLLLGIAGVAGTSAAFMAVGLMGLVALGLLQLPTRPLPESAGAPRAPAPRAAAAQSGSKGLLTPAVLSLTVLYVLLNLGNAAMSSFSVSALTAGHGGSLVVAGMGVTAFTFSSAFGVLVGGWVADRTRHHGVVAAGAFTVTALLVALICLMPLPSFLLVGILGVSGFLSGLITPSRDMLVRAAAPAGAEGRVFGIVSTGFNIGGAAGPVLYGWLLDNGRPEGVFWAAVVFMLLTVALSLVQERRGARERSGLTPAAAQ